jgi:hypothetical protein
MKRAEILIIAIIAIFIQQGCEDNFVTREFPSVLTISVSGEKDGSILFSGRLVSRSSTAVDEVGFVWQSNGEPDIENGFKANLSSRVKEGPFQLRVFTSLKKNTEYYVKAYARIGDITVYGDTWVFISPVDFQPPAFNLSPLTGYAGDTIEISGGLFNRSSDKNSVKVNNLQAEIVETGDSVLRVVVPLNLETKESSVVVTCEGLSTVLSDKFTLVTPAISSFSPSEVAIMDTLTINGSGFNRIKELNIVKIGGFKAAVLNCSNSMITVKVPFTGDSLCYISVTVSAQSATSLVKLKVINPSIDYFVPAEADHLDTLSIIVKNLDPDAVTGVRFGTINARIISTSDTRIEIEVPSALDKEYSDLNILFSGSELVFGYQFHLKQPVISSVSKENVYNQEIITIYGKSFNPVASLNKVYLLDPNTGKNYVLVPTESFGDSIRVKISYIAPPVTAISSGIYNLGIQTCEEVKWGAATLKIIDIWRRLADFPGGARYKGAAFTIGGYGYSGLGAKIGNNMQRDIWKFNPADESWTWVADLPGDGRIFPFVFRNQTYAYIGGGQSLDNTASQVPLPDFYRFNPANNTWTRLKDVSFVEKSYPGASSSPTSDTHVANLSTSSLREYNSVTDEWQETYFGNGAANRLPQSFSINGKTYFVCGNNNDLTNGTNNQVWEYDPSTNTMTRKNDFPGKSRYAGFSFSIGNYGYIGCGVNYVYNVSVEYLDDVWRYNPVTDSWTQFPSYPGGVRSTPVSFVVGNKAYILTGYNTSVTTADVWEFFDPDNN